MEEKKTCCDDCLYYVYDEEYGYTVCEQDLDEDEMRRFLSYDVRSCPYYRSGDEYALVRHHN